MSEEYWVAPPKPIQSVRLAQFRRGNKVVSRETGTVGFKIPVVDYRSHSEAEICGDSNLAVDRDRREVSKITPQS